MLLILTGKMGVGKDTIAKKLCDEYGWKRIVTYTTRPKRDGEIDGVDYVFVSDAAFELGKLQGKFIETTSYKVANGDVWQYGTPCGNYADDDYVLIANPEGVESILKSECGDDAFIVLVVNSSFSEITKRLQRRGDCWDEISRRTEADNRDFKNFNKYHLVVDNRDGKLDEVVEEIILESDLFLYCDCDKEDADETTRIYISGGITGVPNYEEVFNEAEEYLASLGYDVINPARVNTALPILDYDEYLAIDLALLDKCDAIFMLPGWQKSKGAKIEYDYAKTENKSIMNGEGICFTKLDGCGGSMWASGDVNGVTITVEDDKHQVQLKLYDKGIKKLNKFLSRFVKEVE